MRELLWLLGILLLNVTAWGYTADQEFADRQNDCEFLGHEMGRQTFFEVMPYESSGTSVGCIDEDCGDRVRASCDIAMGRSAETIHVLEQSFARACEESFGWYQPSQFTYSAESCSAISDMVTYTPAVPSGYVPPKRLLTAMYSHVRHSRGYCCRIIPTPPNYATQALLCPDGSWASDLRSVTGVHPRQEPGVDDNMFSCTHNSEQRSVLASNDYLSQLESLRNVCTPQGKVLFSVGTSPVSCEKQDPYQNFGHYKCTRGGQAGCCPVYPKPFPPLAPTPVPSAAVSTAPTPSLTPTPSTPVAAPSASASMVPTLPSPSPAMPPGSPMAPRPTY